MTTTMSLLVMIRLTPKNSHGAVYLFDQEKAHHLVGEGHLAKRYFAIRALIDCLRKSVRTTNSKEDVTTR